MYDDMLDFETEGTETGINEIGRGANAIKDATKKVADAGVDKIKEAGDAGADALIKGANEVEDVLDTASKIVTADNLESGAKIIKNKLTTGPTSGSNEAGASTRKFLGTAAGGVGNALEYTADVGEAVARGAVKGTAGFALDIFDIIGDGLAHAGDFVAGAAGINTDFADKEGFLDKMDEGFDNWMKSDSTNRINSEWGEEGIGKNILGGVEGAVEIFVPIVGLVGVAAKGTVAGGKLYKYMGSLLKTKKVQSEIKALKETGKLTDDAVAQVLVKEGKVGIDATKGITKSLGDFAIDPKTGAIITDAIKSPYGAKTLKHASDLLKSEKDAHSLLKSLVKGKEGLKEYSKANPTIWDKIKTDKVLAGILATAVGAVTLTAITDEDPIGDDETIEDNTEDNTEVKTEDPIQEETGDISLAPTDDTLGYDLEKLITDNPELNVRNSIVDYLKALGYTTEGGEQYPLKEIRVPLATKLGIENYSYTAEQNIQMLNKLIEMKLDKAGIDKYLAS